MLKRTINTLLPPKSDEVPAKDYDTSILGMEAMPAFPSDFRPDETIAQARGSGTRDTPFMPKNKL